MLQKCVLAAQLCPTLWDSMGYSTSSSSVYGISQARILEWVAISFSRGSSQPRDPTQVSYIAGRFFTVCDTREAWRIPWTEEPGALQSRGLRRVRQLSNKHTHTHTGIMDSDRDLMIPSGSW